MCDTCGCEGTPRRVSVERALLDANDHTAAHVRAHLEEAGVLALNLLSSPGSGKTTLLVETIKRLAGAVPIAVIEGDQQTSRDADRITAAGAPAVQINTGKGCHLEASGVHDALHELTIERGTLLFIENVGNLVCPAMFDLGERYKVVVISVTEGDDKPLKYPHMFRAAQLLIVNKTDLLPYVDFDIPRMVEDARKVNPDLQVLEVSAKTGEGLDTWIDWLLSRRNALLGV